MIKVHYRSGGTDENPEFLELPAAMDPFRLFESLVKDYADTRIADEAAYGFALFCNERGIFRRAVELVKEFDKSYPKSKWRSDAAALLQEITFPRLGAANVPAVLPGKHPVLAVQTRNLKSFTTTVRKIDIGEFFSSSRYLRDADSSLADLQRNWDQNGLRSAVGGDAVKAFDTKVEDDGKFAYRSTEVEIKVDQTGAYLVELAGEEVAFRSLVFVSNLGIIAKVSGDATTVFAADLSTGKALADADIIVRQEHTASGLFGRYQKITWDDVKTDAKGLAVREHVKPERGNGISLEIFARRGDDYALTFQNWFYAQAESAERVVVYGLTDRPVYRPGDKVHFATTLRRGKDLAYENLPGERVAVTIQDPKGMKIFDELLTTDEFGALKGTIVLGDEPPLGEYSIRYVHGKNHLNATEFRVEEYKKPEFEVTVDGKNVKIGAKAEFKVHGEYLFGGGVAGAKVTYTVSRDRHRPIFRYDEPYAYLYGERRGRRNWVSNREVVVSGEGVTDEKGDLVVAFETAPWATKYKDEDHSFVVEAAMTDLSRRTIEGSGRVLATAAQAFAALEADRGFYRTGEIAGFEIRAQDLDGGGIATAGRIVVQRLRRTIEVGKEPIVERTEVQSFDAETDARGYGLAKWQPDSAGRFALTYLFKDKGGADVKAETEIWVHDANYRAHEFQSKNVEIATDASEYKAGDTAYVMINAVFEDAAVLVSVEADRRILFRDVLPGPGRLRVFALPITLAHIPNIHVHAALVHGGEFHQAAHEIFVPPVEKFMDVALSFDKPVYGPGDRAKLEVRTRKVDGSPIAAQVALSVYDRAITYIQDDQSADIRAFFYGHRRGFYGDHSWGGTTQASVSFQFNGYLTRQPKWKEYAGHGVPPGWHLNEWNRDGFWGGWGEVSQDDGDGGGPKSGGFLGFASESEAGEVQKDDLTEGKKSRAELKDAKGDDFSGGAPGAAASPAPAEASRKLAQGAAGDSRGRGGRLGDATGKPAPAKMRSNFADLAAFDPALRTNDAGVATLEFTLPDSLTSWVAKARALTKDTVVGSGSTSTRTTKNVLVRLQAPRFFTERDEIVVSGIVRSDLAEPVKASVEIELGGGTLAAEGTLKREVEVPAKGEVRIDWTVKVLSTGSADVTMKALTAVESDAMTMNFPVLAYGAEKTVTLAKLLKGDERAEMSVEVPAERRVGSTVLDISLSPSTASALLEALPYLVQYPYGCTEQTLSRFVPAAIVARTLKDMGISLEDIQKRRSELDNKGDLAKGAPLAPVYSTRELNQMIDSGLKRLDSMQNGDGGWGWWSADRSTVHLTAQVVYGLVTAKGAGVDVPTRLIEQGSKFLEKKIADEESLHLRIAAAFALASAGRKPVALIESVHKKRDDLTTYGKAQLALAWHWSDRPTEAKLVLENLEDFAEFDKTNETCHWSSGGSWWYWYGDEIEANAFVLAAFSAIKPDAALVEPLAKWLIANRSGNQWKSTRDTAYAVSALAAYMRTSGELDPDFDAVVSYAGREIARVHVDKANMFAFANRYELRGDAVLSGAHPLVVEKRGKGRLYAMARATFFSQEEKIRGAGHEITIARSYARVTPFEETVERDGKQVKERRWKKEPLADMAQVAAGDEIEVKLTITAANHYEYVLIEDPKASGFEPVELRSGGRYAAGLCSNMELRDEKVVFFVTWFQQGSHELTYRVRAESPGTLAAMPARAVAMYAPKLGGISDSFRIKVADASR